MQGVRFNWSPLNFKYKTCCKLSENLSKAQQFLKEFELFKYQDTLIFFGKIDRQMNSGRQRGGES